MLWHSDFYDGPLSGMCLLNKRPHWFHIAGGAPYDIDADQRVFDIIYLSDEEIKREEVRHEIFRKNVGTHCDYDDQGERSIGHIKPREKWSEFYDLPPLERDYKQIVSTVSESELRGRNVP